MVVIVKSILLYLKEAPGAKQQEPTFYTGDGSHTPALSPLNINIDIQFPCLQKILKAYHDLQLMKMSWNQQARYRVSFLFLSQMLYVIASVLASCVDS